MMRELIENLLNKNDGELQCQVTLRLGEQLAPAQGVLKHGPVSGIYVMYAAMEPVKGQSPKFANLYFTADSIALVAVPVENRIVPAPMDVDFLRRV